MEVCRSQAARILECPIEEQCGQPSQGRIRRQRAQSAGAGRAVGQVEYLSSVSLRLPAMARNPLAVSRLKPRSSRRSEPTMALAQSDRAIVADRARVQLEDARRDAGGSRQCLGLPIGHFGMVDEPRQLRKSP